MFAAHGAPRARAVAHDFWRQHPALDRLHDQLHEQHESDQTPAAVRLEEREGQGAGEAEDRAEVGHDVEDAEGEALLEVLIQEIYAKMQPYFHSWKPTDMIIWDNWRFLHSVSGHDPQHSRRVQRTWWAREIERRPSASQE